MSYFSKFLGKKMYFALTDDCEITGTLDEIEPGDLGDWLVVSHGGKVSRLDADRVVLFREA